MPSNRSWRVATLLAASLLSPAAFAQSEGAGAELKASGNQKMVDSDFVGAIEDYKGALAVAPDDLGLRYDLGRAYGLVGRWPESLAALETFAARATPDLRARIAGFDALLDETRRHVAYLTVTCATPGARVLLDKQVLGAAPLARRALNAGDATVRIEAEGFFDDVQPVKLEGTSERAIECHLLPKSTSGTVTVTAEPARARITIDGVFRGNDRVELPLHAGPHDVSARLDGYEPTSTTLMVVAGSTRTLDLQLHPEAVPITSRWWFWGGLAVVVAGGVAIGVAALTEKPADQGTIAPRQLGTPLVF